MIATLVIHTTEGDVEMHINTDSASVDDTVNCWIDEYTERGTFISFDIRDQDIRNQ